MSEEDPIVNGQPLSNLRVVDLREELEKHGLSKTGNKKELADRLREFLLEGAGHEGSPTKSIPEVASPTKSPENSLVAAYKARQAAALNKATVEKDRVRRASESNSPQKYSPSKTVQKEEESETEPESKEEKRKEEIEEKVEKVQLEMQVKEKKEKYEKSKEKKEQPAAETKSEHPPPKALSPAKESPPRENSKEDVPTTKSHKERSCTPSPETPEEKPKKTSQNGTPMTAVEAEQEDHVELDYGDGDADETNVEDEPKKEDSVELEPPSPVKVAAEEKPKSQERQKIVAPPREKSPGTKKSTSSQKTRDVSPSRYPESEIVHIRGLMRPFTIPNLKLEVCKTGGEIADFWIDNLRSHCFVKMGSVEQATAVRDFLHNHHWPASNPKKLIVQYDNQETMDRHKSGESPALVSASNSRTISTDSHHEKTESTDRKVEKTDRRDRPTLAPLSGRNGLRVTLETMVRDNTKKEEEDRERREKDGREKAREIEKKIKEREVKEKEERENRKRHRSVSPAHHRTDREKQRDRHSPERKERRHNDSTRDEEKKTEEAPVKKTADEFFKKTVAQPSIYYLPLTEEEAVARAAKRERERR